MSDSESSESRATLPDVCPGAHASIGVGVSGRDLRAVWRNINDAPMLTIYLGGCPSRKPLLDEFATRYGKGQAA